MNKRLCSLILIGSVLVTSFALPDQKAFAAHRARRSEISALLRKLYQKRVGHMINSPDERTQQEVVNKLAAIADRSPEKRTEVINRVIKTLDDPVFYGFLICDGCHPLCDLLVRLKATESIDTLIKHIDYSDGIGGVSLSSRPFVTALISFGGAAIPKLEQVLHQGTWGAKFNAVQALEDIGSKQAVEALERALAVETDKGIIDLIKRVLPYVQQ